MIRLALLTFLFTSSLLAHATNPIIVHTTHSVKYTECLIKLAEEILSKNDEFAITSGSIMGAAQSPVPALINQFVVENRVSKKGRVLRMTIPSTDPVGWTIFFDDGIAYYTQSLGIVSELLHINTLIAKVDISSCQPLL